MKIIPIKIKRIIKEGYNDLHDFGLKLALAKVRCILTDESLASVKWKNKVILEYLENKYMYIIEKYKDQKEPKKNNSSVVYAPIWVLWWQGRSEMPDIIKVCMSSKVRAAGKHPVILLTKENIKEYIDFPEYIWEQFKLGNIRIQHMADMIRVQLIEKYGGLWLDASIFCAKKIPEDFFEIPIYTIKGQKDERYVSNNQWTTFVIGGFKKNVLCSFLNEFFLEYCKKEKRFIDYYMFDCMIVLAYKHIASVKNAMDGLNKAKGNCYWLDSKLDQIVTEKLIDEFDKQQSIFYKIGWNKFVHHNKEQETFFNVLLERERLSESES